MGSEKYVISGPEDEMLPLDLSFGQQILDCLKSGGDKQVLVDGLTGETITCRELLQKSVNLATSLHRLGIRKKDVICLASENRFEFTISAFAIFYIGGVVTTLNITYTEAEMKHVLNLSKPRFIFCSPLCANLVKEATDGLPFVEGLVQFGEELVIDGGRLYNSLVANNINVDSFRVARVDPARDEAVILCSSGTTGLPKGVMLTHHNLLYSFQHLKRSLEDTGRSADEITIFSVIPWFHAYGFVTHTVFAILHCKFVYAFRFEEESFLRIIQDYKANVILTVPPLVLFLAKHPLVSKYDLSSVEEVWCGAAPLSKEVQELATKRINLKLLKQGYGMTETTLGVLYDFSQGAKTGTAGTIANGTKVKVVDLTTGEALGPFKEGELCFKGPLIMKGYVGDVASTENLIDADGWLHSGDIGYYDSDEYFYIIDRLKELIKYKGFQVPPAELEAILFKHEGVKDAAVVGLEDEAVGEKALAFVVRQDDSKVTKEELVRYVAQRVSPAKHLHGGVRFIDEIPKNPSGKILRRELRDALRRERRSKL